MQIKTVGDQLKKAADATGDAQKARLAYPCINSTLWASEALEYERAQQDIQKYRKGNATLTVLDQDAKPASNVNVTVTQITHDFLFGVSREGPLDNRTAHAIFEHDPDAESQTKIGMNFINLQFWWSTNEPVPGQYDFSVNSLGLLKHLKEIGVRMGGEGLISLEPGFETWGTGLMNLGFDELKARIHDHVKLLVSMYAKYVDYWIVYTNPNQEASSLGFTRDQIMELIRVGIQAVKESDPTSQVLVFFDTMDGSKVGFEGSDDNFSADPYTFFSLFKDYDINDVGMSLFVVYGAVHEFPPDAASQIQAGPNKKIYFDFRDLGSISRIFDWYNTLGVPVHITDFFASGQFSTQLGYWHKSSWDEDLKSEWIKEFYTIAFSKPLVKQITYWDSVDQDFMTTEPGLLDANYVPRESFYALKRLITEDWTTRLVGKTDENGQVMFRGFAGDYAITIMTKNGLVNSTIHVDEQASQAYMIKMQSPMTNQSSTTALSTASLALPDQAWQALVKLGTDLNAVFMNPSEIVTLYHSPDARNLLNQSYSEYQVAQQMFESKDYAGALQHAQKAQDLYNQAQILENQYRQQQSTTTPRPIENPLMIPAGALGIIILLAAIILRRRKSISQRRQPAASVAISDSSGIA
jgi:endo-1,4-beta-xylanase